MFVSYKVFCFSNNRIFIYLFIFLIFFNFIIVFHLFHLLYIPYLIIFYLFFYVLAYFGLGISPGLELMGGPWGPCSTTYSVK